MDTNAPRVTSGFNDSPCAASELNLEKVPGHRARKAIWEGRVSHDGEVRDGRGGRVGAAGQPFLAQKTRTKRKETCEHKRLGGSY